MNKKNFDREITIIRYLKPIEEYLKKEYPFGINFIKELNLDENKYHEIIGLKLFPPPGINYFNYLKLEKGKSWNIKLGETSNYIMEHVPKAKNYVDKCNIPFFSEIFLIVSSTSKYSNLTFRDNNWLSRNLCLTGDFKWFNSDKVFNDFIDIGLHPKYRDNLYLATEKIGHFLDNEVARLHAWFQPDGYEISELNNLIIENLDIQRLLRRALRTLEGTSIISGIVGHGDLFISNVLTEEKGFKYASNKELIIASTNTAHLKHDILKTIEINELRNCNVLIIKRNGKYNEVPILEKPNLFKDNINDDEFLDRDFKFEETRNSQFSFFRKPEDSYQFNLKIKSIPISLKTGLQQYLLFFREYVGTAKQKNIQFDVANIEDGLELKLTLENENELEDVQRYLLEYIQHAKEKLSSPIEVEGNPNPDEIDLLKLRMAQQIANFEVELKLREFKIKTLKKNNKRLISEKNKLFDIISHTISNAIPSLVELKSKRFEVERDYKIEKLKEFIRKGEIDKLFKKIKALNKYFIEGELDEFTIYENRWNRIKKQRKLNVLDEEKLIQEENRVIINVLQLLNELSEK